MFFISYFIFLKLHITRVDVRLGSVPSVVTIKCLNGEVVSVHRITAHFKLHIFFSLTIQCVSGVVVSANRTAVYCYGHWLGKADLAYCLQGGSYDCQPMYSRFVGFNLFFTPFLK